jgi:hypothetical protein
LNATGFDLSRVVHATPSVRRLRRRESKRANRRSGKRDARKHFTILVRRSTQRTIRRFNIDRSLSKHANNSQRQCDKNKHSQKNTINLQVIMVDRDLIIIVESIKQN